MKMRTTAILGGATLALAVGAYLFDYKIEEKQAKQKEMASQIITFNPEQINFIEILKKNEKIVLEKNETGWTLLEPIQDSADNNQVEDLVKVLSDEKMIAVAKDSVQLTNIDLKEFGLDEPAVTYSFKNNAGNSTKVTVGSQKNFEGNSFLRLNSENKVLVANSVWLSKADNNVLYYREKRLYRHPLGAVMHVTISSLQDHFELKKVDGQWRPVNYDYVLDQNKVREMLRKISAASIQEYVFEGEPSSSLLKEKGLLKSPVRVKLDTAEADWSVEINQNEKEKALFALTDRPTALVRLDITEWEFFGNLSLDSLRDRTTLTRFNIDEVKKIFYKAHGREMSFVKEGLLWRPLAGIADGQEFSGTELVKILNRIHDLEISEFVVKGTEVFKGLNMIILKSESDRLVYQINWGPALTLKRNGAEKEYYLTRTQVAPQIFAMEKSKMDSIDFSKVIQAKATSIVGVSGDETQKAETVQ